MEPFMIILYTSMGINMALYAGIAGFLIYRAIKTKLTSILYLAISLIFLDICFIFYITNDGASTFYHLFRASGVAWLIVFNYMTFLKGKRKFSAIFLGIALLTTIIICVAYEIYLTTGIAIFRALTDILFGLLTIFISGWQFNTARVAYRKIEHVQMEPFIKKRYQLYLNASIALAFTGLFSGFIVTVYDSFGTAILFLGVSISSLTYLVINFLIWVMPPFLKTRLNAGWTPKVETNASEDELSEEELMAQFMEEDPDE